MGENSVENLPTLIKYIAGNEVDGFDSVNGPNKLAGFRSFRPKALDIEAVQAERTHSVSISMPNTPLVVQSPNAPRALQGNNPPTGDNAVSSPSVASDGPGCWKPKKTSFFSQSMPTGAEELPPRNNNSRMDKLKDKRFDSFKTWSGRLERQLSNLRGKRHNAPSEDDPDSLPTPEIETVPVDRYFDALEGPELETLKASEEIILPDNKEWPFLLRFPITSFGICLGVSSQAIMWKSLAVSSPTGFLHISLDVNLVLWIISVALVVFVGFIYCLKLVFYFEAVRREYHHPIRVNFFFAPWIALLLLATGVPPSLSKNLHEGMWYVLMAPVLSLELKIYGQWMSGGQRRLSKVANPSNHLSIVGNFVGSSLGASMGLREGPIFFFAIGLAHYMVLFVTLYQRLPTNETLPKELHPVFFLFVAAPSVASMAWANIHGSFDYGSRISYFIAMFLYFSLVVRINFFRGFRFSLAWWAYTFPMTGAAIATIRYANAITNTFTKTLSVTLSAVATLTVAALLVTTIVHAFVLRDLFPNDIAIAISETRPRSGGSTKRWYHWGSSSGGSEEAKHTENNYHKYLYSEDKDIESNCQVNNTQ